MKTITKLSIFILVLVSLGTFNVSAQYKVVVKDKDQKNKVSVIKYSRHHYRKAVVYHPKWAPRISFTKRWVYFPRYNFYWDNINSVYVIRTGRVWVTSAIAPKEIENVNLTKEKKVELSEENDGLDSIQQNNEMHQKKYISN